MNDLIRSLLADQDKRFIDAAEGLMRLSAELEAVCGYPPALDDYLPPAWRWRESGSWVREYSRAEHGWLVAVVMLPNNENPTEPAGCEWWFDAGGDICAPPMSGGEESSPLAAMAAADRAAGSWA